jgi:hypothetical protein
MDQEKGYKRCSRAQRCLSQVGRTDISNCAVDPKTLRAQDGIIQVDQ